jgi:hypothetical protein
VGADGASSAATDRLVWDFTDFKPTLDVGTAYIFATPWKELQAAEAAVNQPGAGPTEFLRAAQGAILLLGPAQHPNGPNKWLEERYASSMQQWAAKASVLGTADSWNAVGDVDLFTSGAIWRFGMRCWPEAAAADYQRAAELGSEAAAQQLAYLHGGGDYGLPPGMADGSSRPACGSQQPGNEPGPVAGPAPVTAAGPEGGPSGGAPQGAPDTLTDGVRGDVLAAVDRANAAWAAASQSLDPSALNGNVGSQELRSDLAELDKLRSQGHKRNNVNTAFTVTDVTLDTPGHATVRTHETWYAEISNAASGRLLQRTPPETYDETYTVEYLNGSWIVTENDLNPASAGAQ